MRKKGWIIGIMILLIIIFGIFFINNKYFVEDNLGESKGPYEEDVVICSDLNAEECGLESNCFLEELCVDYVPSEISKENCNLVGGEWQPAEISGNTYCLLRTKESCEGLGYLWITKCEIKPAHT